MEFDCNATIIAAKTRSGEVAIHAIVSALYGAGGTAAVVILEIAVVTRQLKQDAVSANLLTVDCFGAHEETIAAFHECLGVGLDYKLEHVG